MNVQWKKNEERLTHSKNVQSKLQTCQKKIILLWQRGSRTTVSTAIKCPLETADVRMLQNSQRTYGKRRHFKRGTVTKSIWSIIKTALAYSNA